MKNWLLLPVLVLSLNAYTAEYFVNPEKGDDGNAGTATAPLKNIATAIKKASPAGGDTITLQGGVYRQNIQLTSAITATAENPFVVQGAKGERVIITGFEPITGWKEAGNGIYTAEAPDFINGLFVGLAPQPIARWPRTAGGWQPFGEGDKESQSFVALDGLDKIPDIQAIAKDLRSAQMYVYIQQSATYSTFGIKSLDFEKNKLFVEMRAWYDIFKGVADFFAVQNHPVLIKEVGDWAVARKEAGGKESIVYFKPKSPEDLNKTFFRTRGTLVDIRGTGIVVRNLEVSGAFQNGINSGSAQDSTIEGCLIHNGYDTGINVRSSKNMTVRNNISLANEGVGISIASTDTALVEGNEICFNMVDGLRVVGNASGRPGTEPDSTNVTVRRNYLHHHYYLSHPDNMQTFMGVSQMKMNDNLFLFGGQNTMTQGNSDSEMRGNVSMFTAAYIVIFGHKSAHRWLVEGNTWGYGGWGSFLLEGSQDHKFFNNIFIGTNGVTILSDTQSDNNVYITRPYALGVLTANKALQTEIEKAREVTGTDAKSLALDTMTFKNMPQAMSLYERYDDKANLATCDYLPLRTRGGKAPFAKVADFAIGDNVEINGDGVMRKVSEVDDKGIKFSPAMPLPPFRDAFILNWGKSTSTQLDLALAANDPILKAGRDGKPAGASLDIAAFQRGELLENGKRSLPAIPEDLKAAWPNPNFYIPPMTGR